MREPSSVFPQTGGHFSTSRRIDASISEITFIGKDARTGLSVRIECTKYHDYPVVEWIAWFTNESNEPTPVIRDILAMDRTFRGSSPVVYHCNGDFRSNEGYTPVETALREGNVLEFSPKGGRPCDGAFPYHRVIFEECGLSMAIGWPGQWSVSFQGLAEGVHVRAGQEVTNLHLMPGEKIRTPRMTVLSWTGNVSRAVNLWRRWYLTHLLPRPDGQPLKPLLACSGTDDGKEYTAAAEENQIRYIKKAKQHGIPFDLWWIDAGWYPCYSEKHGRKVWSATVGTWEPDPE